MKHKLFSRFISVLLAVVMLASLMSMPSLATDDVQEPDPAVTSGEQMTDSTESDVADPTADSAAQSDEITDEGDEDTSSGDNTDETVVSGEENDETVVSDEENDENVVSDEENSEETVPGEEEATVPSEEEAVSNDEAASSDEEEDASSQEETAPAAVQLTAEAKDENDNVVANVTAEADEGVIPEGASLVADLLTGNDAETAAAELDEAGVEYDGYMALDIHLEDADGNEVEPNGEVRVVMVAPAALPEDADPTTVAVQHHEEQDNGEVKVEEVASAADTTATPATLSLTEDSTERPATGVATENTDVTAAFDVENFSTFTIIWQGEWSSDGTLTVHYWDADKGQEFTGPLSEKQKTLNYNDVVKLYDYADEIPGYTFVEARAEQASGKAITAVQLTRKWTVIPGVGGHYDYQWKYLPSNDSTLANWGKSADRGPEKRHVYLIYKSAVSTGPVTIQNNIIDTGRLNALVEGSYNPEDQYIFTWYRNNTPVETATVTGSETNVGENWLNPALDIESLCVDKTNTDKNTIRSTEYTYKVVVTDAEGKDIGTATFTVPYYAQLMNGSFETPDATKVPSDDDNGKIAYQPYYRNGRDGLYWKTTASDGLIEFINTKGENADSAYKHHYASTAADGSQYAELNGNMPGTLYQDVLTVPGATLYWQLSHRGRGTSAKDNGTDTMYVLIASKKNAETITTQDQVDKLVEKWIEAGEPVGGIEGFNITEITSNNKKWYTKSGSYPVPEGQYLTRFFFAAGETAYDQTGQTQYRGTVGNHLDAVWFSPQLPPPEEQKGHLQITKEVDGIDKTAVPAGSFSFTVKDSDNMVAASFTLPTEAGGWSYSLTNLPADATYTIEESTPSAKIDDYDYKNTTVNNTVTRSTTATIVSKEVTTVTFVNHYEEDTSNEYPVRFYLEGIQKNVAENYEYTDAWATLDSLLSQGYANVTTSTTPMYAFDDSFSKEVGYDSSVTGGSTPGGIKGDANVETWMNKYHVSPALNMTNVAAVLTELTKMYPGTGIEDAVVASAGGTSYKVSDILEDPSQFQIVYTQVTQNHDQITEHHRGNGDTVNGQDSYHVHLTIKKNPGNLTITKTYTGVDRLPDDFAILVTNSVNQPVQTLTLDTASVDPSTDNKYTWNLEMLDEDTYTVTETAYEVTNKDLAAKIKVADADTTTPEEVNDTTASVKVADAETSTVDITNTYTDAAGDLKITKTLTDMNALKGNTASFIFKITNTLTNKAYYQTLTFTGAAKDVSCVLSNLPAGNYKVEELGVSGYTGACDEALNDDGTDGSITGDKKYATVAVSAKNPAEVSFTNNRSGNTPGGNSFAYNQFTYGADKQWHWSRADNVAPGNGGAESSEPATN